MLKHVYNIACIREYSKNILILNCVYITHYINLITLQTHIGHLACVLDDTYHILDDLVLAILSLDFQEVVAEVEEVEAPLLSQQHDDGTASPV